MRKNLRKNRPLRRLQGKLIHFLTYAYLLNSRKAKAQKADGNESEGWSSKGSDQDDDDDESDEDDVRKYLQSSDPMVRRNYWLKRETTKEAQGKPDREERGPRGPRPERVKKVYSDEEAKPKQKIVYTLDELDKKIVEIVERRAGRKASVKDKKVSVEEDLEALNEFFEKVQDDEIKKLEVCSISNEYRH